MRKLIKKWMPAILRDAWRALRAHKRALAEDRRLIAMQIPEPPVSGSCNLLSSREEMLGALPKGSVGAEVGVATGDFTAEILRIVNPRKLYLIDPWELDVTITGKVGGKRGLELVSERFAGEIGAGTVSICRGYSREELAKFSDGDLDWIYIDAAHDFQNAYADLMASRRIVKPGGLICGHDYTRWGNMGLGRFGVVEAVNKFCVENRYQLAFLTNEAHRHVSFAIRLPT